MLLLQISSNDLDSKENRQVRYRFADSSDDTFSIDQQTGVIALNKPLDRETVAV